jgi:hypothetical protein
MPGPSAMPLLFKFHDWNFMQENSFNPDADISEILILQQLGKVSYKGFTAMHSDGKPMTGLIIVEKAKYFYDEVKIMHKSTFCDG